jgi:Arc/MetJ-type ribon-helix-helix transcriptional regulator
MKLITFNIPEKYLEILELYVAEKKFPNRSEAIRMGIRDLIKREFLHKKPIKEETQDESQEKEKFNRK